MDIAAVSTVMAQANLKMQAGTLLTKKVMANSKEQMNGLVAMMEQMKMEQSVTPHVGKHVDVKL